MQMADRREGYLRCSSAADWDTAWPLTETPAPCWEAVNREEVPDVENAPIPRLGMGEQLSGLGIWAIAVAPNEGNKADQDIEEDKCLAHEKPSESCMQTEG